MEISMNWLWPSLQRVIFRKEDGISFSNGYIYISTCLAGIVSLRWLVFALRRNQKSQFFMITIIPTNRFALTNSIFYLINLVEVSKKSWWKKYSARKIELSFQHWLICFIRENGGKFRTKNGSKQWWADRESQVLTCDCMGTAKCRKKTFLPPVSIAIATFDMKCITYI